MKRAIAFLLIALATATSCGCLVIEKKTLIMIVPPESNEIRLYYVFEGISVLEGEKSGFAQAQSELDNLQRDNFSFFVSGLWSDTPLLRHCRFEKLRFFTDSERKRSLCADRRVTIHDREKFANRLNSSITETLAASFFEKDEKDSQEKIKQASADSKTENAREEAMKVGMRPLQKTAEGLLEIAAGFDLASIKRLKGAVQDDFPWVRFEPDIVGLVLPATPECARRIAADPKSKDWLKEMRTLVEPIDLQACDEGLAVVVGKKGEAIRLTFSDPRPHRASDEERLAKYAGSPEALILGDGKKANAARLIKLFIAEQTTKP